MRLLIKLMLATSSMLILLLCLFIYLSPKPLLLQNLDFSYAIYDDSHHLLRLTLTNDEQYRLYTPLKNIKPYLIEATLLKEDKYFFQHIGINPIALIKAFWNSYLRKQYKMGASTISMQLVRIKFGLNTKTLAGKLLQILYALQLERHYSKNEILEAYLNLAPYGANIQGVGAASLIYFNHDAKNISLLNALTLVIMPQNPNWRTPQNHELKNIRNRLLMSWIENHPKDKYLIKLSKLPLAIRTREQLNFLAPHFVNYVLQNQNQISEHKYTINSSLNLTMQQVLEQTIYNYLQRQQKFGVNNAAALLIDSRDLTIKAMLGSGGFFNKQINGQINGTIIKRSPGSTLKPFIYARAIDEGLIHPSSMLKDVPSSFGSYNPENFDNDFMGPIKAKDALILSRNIPAIYLENELKHNNLYKLLTDANISSLKDESYYGLSLSLGGAEVTMLELTSLYAMLVNGGYWQPIVFISDAKRPTGKTLLSHEASFLILDMLKDTPRPSHFNAKFSLGDNIAWKTGTSSAFRDAWTVGVYGPYVISVWLGNFDNKANPALIGKNIAAPLFFELIKALKPVLKFDNYHAQAYENLNLIKTEICRASGLLPTVFCHDRELGWFIPSKSPIKSDNIFREVAINPKSGLRTCHINQDTKFAIFEFWPSDLLAIFKRAGIRRNTPPFYEAGCAINSTLGLRPTITSPSNQLHYIIRNTVNHNDEINNTIPLSVVTDADVEYVYWFANDALLTKIKADKTFLWHAKPGHYVLRVVDDHGYADIQVIDIEGK